MSKLALLHFNLREILLYTINLILKQSRLRSVCAKVKIYVPYRRGVGLCHLLCSSRGIYTILSGLTNLTNECRGVLLVTSYVCPMRTNI